MDINKRPIVSITKMIFVSSIIALMLLLNLSGCAPSSGTVKKNPGPGLISQPVSLDFISLTTGSSLVGMETETGFLSDHIVSGLRETQLFPTVSANPVDAGVGSGIKVEIQIKAIKKVSDDSRAWFGTFAGQAQVVVQATISDLSSGHPIETFEAEGLSGKSAKAGTTDEALQRAAEQVVGEIVRLNARTAQ